MKLLIENKSQLTAFVSKIENYLSGTYLKVRHQKLKECIAKTLGFEKYASIQPKLPLEIETEEIFFEYFENHDKMFAHKADGKKNWFASRLHCEFIKDYVSNDFEECIKTLLRVEEPEIFVDRGWGDAPLAISVISDGDGQFPYLYITRNVYDELLSKGYIGNNVLETYKARKLHIFNKDKYLESV